MGFLIGFVIFSIDLALLHSIAMLMVGGNASPLFKAIVGIFGVSKFLIVGAAYFMAISVYSLDGFSLFLGSGLALFIYFALMVRHVIVGNRQASC